LLDPRCDPHGFARSAVHRLVRQPVGVLVALARDPLERDLVEAPTQHDRLASEWAHRRVLHLPPSGHLFDDELGVHPHGDSPRT
jgi:hypothetical protein